MKILCISDLHFVSKESYVSIPERKCNFGLEFLERVLRREYGNFDLIVVCGDFVDDGNLDSAENDFLKIKNLIEKTGISHIFVRGNHDIEMNKFLKISGKVSTLLEYGEYIFYPFHDNYKDNDRCYRKKEEIEKFINFCKLKKNKKIITLQHNTVYPEIKEEYPYNIENKNEILKAYEENNVILSISGHFHRSIEEKKYKGMYFLTLPAMCENPFSYYIIELDEKTKFYKKALFIKHQFPLIDFHCHTEFAYCGKNVDSEKNIERAKLFGIDGIVLTEHSAQLYLSSDDYWHYKFLDGIDILYRTRKEKKDRMGEFKKKILPLKNGYVKVGMEVESDKNGNITLLPEDREGIDYLLGAVHSIPCEYMVSKEKVKKGFLKFTEFLCKNSIDILAHPLRFFIRNKMEVPKGIYDDVIKILKRYNVAAELNFHTNTPDPLFFEKCVENGIKISLGSDSHSLVEVGEFSKHIELLKEINAATDEFLYKWAWYINKIKVLYKTIK